LSISFRFPFQTSFLLLDWIVLFAVFPAMSFDNCFSLAAVMVSDAAVSRHVGIAQWAAW
jgi:hypothetical protein